MAPRNPTDRNAQEFTSRFFGSPRDLSRDPGDRDLTEAHDAYRELHASGSFLRTLAFTGMVVGGGYMLGRRVPRDHLRHAFHALGQVGKDFTHTFQQVGREFSDEVLRRSPYHPGLGPFLSDTGRTQFKNLELTSVLEPILAMQERIGATRAVAYRRSSQSGMYALGEIAEGHLPSKFLKSAPRAGRLQYATVGDVFTDTSIQQAIGQEQFSILSRARRAGLISDKFALAPGEFTGLYKNGQGRIIDSRWAKPANIGSALHKVASQFQIPIINAKPADWIANLFRPFGEGKYFAELGGGLPIGQNRTLKLPGLAFGMAGQVFEESTRSPGLFRRVSSGHKFFDAAQTGNLLAQSAEAFYGQHGLQRHVIRYPGGRRSPGEFLKTAYAYAQDLTGIGSQYRTREHIFQSVMIDPLRRQRMGNYVPFAGGHTAGFGYISASAERKPFLETVVDALRGTQQTSGNVFNSRGSQAAFGTEAIAKHFKIPGGGDELRSLFGLEERGVHLSHQGMSNFQRLGYIAPEDLAVRRTRFFPKLGRRRMTGSDLAEDAQAALGSRSAHRKVTNFAAPSGTLNTLAMVGNYHTLRLNDMLSATLGFGFRPGAGRLGAVANLARVYGGYWGIRAGLETLDYADYLAEEATGVSPKKAALHAYSYARTGLQYLRQGTGYSAAMGYAEDLMPGSVDSPLSQGLRFGYPIARGLLTRGKVAGGAALGAFLGWGDPTKDPQQIRDEHTGEELVPYRRSRWWMLGRQPFTGGQIDYYGPSWIARQLSDYKYTDVLYGSRQEYFQKQSFLPTPTNLFGLSRDTSYFERKHAESRPYPVSTTGDTTRVTEMISTQPTVERDLREGVSEKLGYSPYERASFSAEPSNWMSEKVDQATQLLGIYKFIGWNLPGFADPLGGRGELASADAMTSHSRSFYDEQMGGMLGLSEMYRRFVPDEKEMYKLNKIPNTMPDWLPGVRSVFERDRSYYIDYSSGDPYTKLRHGEARLPGGGYDRLHRLHSETPGVYDPMDRFLILADVAPYSEAYRHYKAIVEGWASAGVLDAYWRKKLGTTTDQVSDKLKVHEFNPRRFTGLLDADKDHLEAANEYNMIEKAVGGAWEVLTHDVTPGLANVFPIVGPILGDKLLPVRSPIEAYKKWELYGEDFADWRTPWKSFVRPKLHELTASDPATATFGGAMMGVFGANPLAKLFIGSAGAVGLGASSAARVLSTGQMTGGYIPEHRQEERAMKEYLDALTYVKNRRLEVQARQRGERRLASEYRHRAGRTVTGLDYELPYQYFRNQARAALDKRERGYFDAFMDAESSSARQEILSVVPDYVKPIYRAAWTKKGLTGYEAGVRFMPPPDTRAQQYFQRAPLPSGDWAGWHPDVPMSAIRVKAVDSAASSTALDRHRFNLWGPQSELAYREYPELDVPVVDLASIRRQGNERQAFLDQLHQQNMDVRSTWEGSLSADTVSWDLLESHTHRAMAYAGRILG